MNYTQYPRDSVAIPGALGLGQATASTLSSAFMPYVLGLCTVRYFVRCLAGAVQDYMHQFFVGFALLPPDIR